MYRPGTTEEQAQWTYYANSRMTGSMLEQEIKQGVKSIAPLTDLQREMIAIATGLSPGGPQSLDMALNKAEADSLETEHQGALFVQKQMRDFLQRQKEEAAKLKAKEKEEWVVL